ncbi:MAG: substrate-binding domain-containing protein [Propionibacteriaceae bacterium]|nr:substrate-binding domain-containing protein [Propionibacteriaceae bacterium]
MMKLMRLPAAVLAAGVLTLAAGCAGLDTGTGGGQTPTAGGTETTGSAIPAACTEANPFLAVALPNLTNPYYVAMKQGFEDEGKKAGFNVEVQVAGDDDANQLSQVQAMLQKKPCALALNAVKSEPAAAIVREANNAGVPVFTVNVTLNEDALKAQNATIIQYLGADNRAGGQQTAEQVLQDLGADAELKIGFVSEPDEVPVVVRDEGFTETIKTNPNAEIVATVDGNVKPDDSLRVTSEMMQGHPEINVIFASTGPAAYGAIQATEGMDVKVYGFCAAEEPLTDSYPACVAQEPEDYGRRVVQEIVTWKGGGTVEAEILRPLKLFVKPEVPGPGFVG